jgi:hypothetical protein
MASASQASHEPHIPQPVFITTGWHEDIQVIGIQQGCMNDNSCSVRKAMLLHTSWSHITDLIFCVYIGRSKCSGSYAVHVHFGFPTTGSFSTAGHSVSWRDTGFLRQLLKKSKFFLFFLRLSIPALKPIFSPWQCAVLGVFKGQKTKHHIAVYFNMLPLVGLYDRWLANTTVGCFWHT